MQLKDYQIKALVECVRTQGPEIALRNCVKQCHETLMEEVHRRGGRATLVLNPSPLSVPRLKFVESPPAASVVQVARDADGSYLFEMGHPVEWTSQAGSYTKRKVGVVVEVVEPGKRPSRVQFPSLYKQGCGWGRNARSYVVRVGKQYYWPHAPQLKPAVDEGG